MLSSNDPVRVFQDFATVDLIREGRAEITAGRGWFIESFPLFGYDPHTVPLGTEVAPVVRREVSRMAAVPAQG